MDSICPICYNQLSKSTGSVYCEECGFTYPESPGPKSLRSILSPSEIKTLTRIARRLRSSKNDRLRLPEEVLQMSNVIKLSEVLDDGTKDTPAQLAGEIQDAVRERKPTKMLVLFLDDRDGSYDISFLQAGMKASEMLALLECSKSMVKEYMGY